MSPLSIILLLLLLISSSYAAGRLHGQLSYRIGYRFGYRQGYFDGDRGAWNRRRREARAAFTAVLSPPAPSAAGGAVPASAGAVMAAAGGIRGQTEQHDAIVTPYRAHTASRRGTTYLGAAFAATSGAVVRESGETLVAQQG